MKTSRIALPGILIFLLLAGIGFSEDAIDLDEDDFFDSIDVEAAEGEAEVEDINAEIDKEMVGLSGNLEATSSYTMSRDFFDGLEDWDDNILSHMVVGDFLIDIRLKKGFRAFMDLNIGYLTNGSPIVHEYTVLSSGMPPEITPFTTLIVTEEMTTLIGIKEIFLDFNIANVVYFRAGKQVLQWGRGYLWNPTDLINIDRRSFSNMNALREGVFGLRTDIVFVHEFHLYTFLDLHAVDKISETAFAARAEFLAGTIEFGVSSWFKNEKIPVFGADISIPIFWDISMTAEGSVSWGDNTGKMATDGSTSLIRDELVPKIAAGFMKKFDFMDVYDRIIVNAEFYYNHVGYDDNMFETLDPALLPDFLAGYYQSGNYGKYYGALFVTVNEFIRKDMIFSISGMGNFSDLSFIVMPSVGIIPVDNFTLTFTAASYIGPDNREYTMSINPSTFAIGNNMLFLSIGARVVF